MCIYIYNFVTHRLSYHNSSVWLDSEDAWSKDQKPPKFTLDLVSYQSDIYIYIYIYIIYIYIYEILISNIPSSQQSEPRHLRNYKALCSHFHLFTFLPYRITRVLNSFEELCIMRVAAINSFTRVLNFHRGAYILSSTLFPAQSTGAVEYTDCTSAEG